MTTQQPKDHGFQHASDSIYHNVPNAVLIENAVRETGGKLTQSGSLVVYTGKHTGRAPHDKYVVVSNKTENTIDWENNLNKMSKDVFDAVKKDIIAHINSQPKLYWSEKNVGSIENLSMAVEMFSTHPSHTLFFNHLMRNDKFDSANKGFGKYTIYHAPTLEVDSNKYDLRSSTVIALDLDNNEVLIAGTLYAGEIKKSIFSVMNYILPEKGILPMHAGSSVGESGDVSVFFGLSGTGKTTLSTQEGRLLIGDDEHGLSDDGIFNFEGGCYAKTYNLSFESEPGIWKATNRYGALLENVPLKANGQPDFYDKSITENGRSAYPLNYIEGVEKSSRGKVPNHMFFLSADAFGVLPPVSKLSKNQAMYYFLSGYTSKLAGTEMGITEPQATFSTCFGAPFMMRHPEEYAKLLGEYIEKHNIKVWLINTGWTSGAYGVGMRFPLKITRRLIEAIQHDELNDVQCDIEEFFGFCIPPQVKGVERKFLNPRVTWPDSDGYNTMAKKLAHMFADNFKRFDGISKDVLTGGPKV
ncbi:MAG: phosphoenolpyruvate carboxykinase (ATP) [Halobacteriovoraceae bacterium]|nr:phosphoenolpyruvate carboxykinase (ATP) [Halobacteriovoraceae bacterium]MCB9095205.1 phosphoenolpyruvate carboxykinase (ATP) [Halobacteriovoraceae bacterium]